jgi:outer membrane protein assembly factor BamB
LGACPWLLLAQSSRPSPIEDPFRRFRDAAEQPAPLLPTEIAWTVTLPAGPSAGGALDGERLYIPLRDARLVAINRDTGELRWSRVVHSNFAPLAQGGLVFVLQGSAVRALDASTGVDRWIVVLESPPATALQLASDRLLTTGEGGEVRALDAASGALLWRQTLGAVPIHAPAVHAETAYVVLADNRLVAVSLADGSVRWQQSVPGRPSPPAAGPSRVYVGSTDNALYAFDPDDGDARWRMAGGGDVLGADLDNGLLYYVSLDNVVRALNQGNGNQRWRRESGTRPTFPPLAFGGLVLVPGLSPAINVVNARTGESIGAVTLAQGSLAGPPLIDRTLPPFRPGMFLLTREGVLEARRSVPLMFREPPAVPLSGLPGRAVRRETSPF